MLKKYLIKFIAGLSAICMSIGAVGCFNNGEQTPDSSSSTDSSVEESVSLIQLVDSNITMLIGESKKLAYTYEEEGEVEWTVSDSSVATVDQEGNVRALANGTVVVTASVGEYDKAFCTINVIIPVTPVYSLTLSYNTVQIGVGQTFALNAVLMYGEEIKDVTFAWSSSAQNVASVDNDGAIIGLTAGQTTIKAEYTLADNTKISATCTVFVRA